MKRRESISWRRTSTSTPLRAKQIQRSFPEEAERECNRNLDILSEFVKRQAERKLRKIKLEVTDQFKLFTSYATIMQQDTLEMSKQRDNLIEKLNLLSKYSQELAAVDALKAVAESQVETVSQMNSAITSDGIRVKKQPHEEITAVMNVVQHLKEDLPPPSTDLIKIKRFAEANESTLQLTELRDQLETVVTKNIANNKRQLEPLESEFSSNLAVIRNLPDFNGNSIK